MPALLAYYAGMKSRRPKIQYSLRGVSERTDRQLREKAAEYGLSLNETTLKILQQGLGETGSPLHLDFDKYAGRWVADKACETALEEMRAVDEDLWR